LERPQSEPSSPSLAQLWSLPRQLDCVFESKNPKKRSFELAGARERAKIEEQQRRAEARAEQ
jgi:hypothetical protein